jgi:hypothetical protein
VVTLTATVVAGTTPVTTGQVKFCDATAKYCEDIHIVGTAQLTAAGTAVFKFRPGVGSHSYKAVFAGTKSYAGSASAAAALTVSGPAKHQSITTITAASATGSYNYNLSASVFGTGSTAPTGTVPIIDTSNNGALVATETLAAGSKGVYLPISSILAIGVPAGGSAPGMIAVGDFNGDGIPDLAFGTSGSAVTILLGNGDGTFTASAVDLGPSVSPIALAVGDFNEDGIQDLAVQCEYINGSGGGIVEILLGNGDGTFSVKPGPTTVNPYFSYGIAVGDFNGDGIWIWL